MNSKLLLPGRFKKWGILLLLPSLALGILVRFFDFRFDFLTVSWKTSNKLFENDNINFTDEIALTGIILGLIFIAFSREKNEDEFINRTRLESLQWAVLINYGLLIVATWLVHGLNYIDVMMYNMLTVLIIFIIRFHMVLRRNNKSLTD
jgi:uncharacterized membrane protein